MHGANPVDTVGLLSDEIPQVTFKAEVGFLTTKLSNLKSMVNDSMFTRNELNAIQTIVAQYDESINVEAIFLMPRPIKKESLEDTYSNMFAEDLIEVRFLLYYFHFRNTKQLSILFVECL